MSGRTMPTTVRLGLDELAHHKRQANANGRPLATHLALLIKEGAIAETVMEIEQRLRANLLESGSARSTVLPDDAQLSLFTTEALLTAIVQQRDVQELQRAQESARQRLASLKAAKGQ